MWPFTSKQSSVDHPLDRVDKLIEHTKLTYEVALHNERVKVAKLESDCRSLQTKVDAAETKVREQTDNDLIATSVRIILSVIHNKPVPKGLASHQAHLMQQSQMWERSPYGRIGAASIGNVFGGLL